MATAGVMLFKGPQARQYTQKPVHRQGGTHTRRPVATVGVATVGVMLFNGPEARRYTQKTVQPQGGMWPPHGSCYFKGLRGMAPALSEISRRWGGVGGGGMGGYPPNPRHGDTLAPPPPGLRERPAVHSMHMHCRPKSHRAPPWRPVSLKIGPQLKSNQIKSPPLGGVGRGERGEGRGPR